MHFAVLTDHPYLTSGVLGVLLAECALGAGTFTLKKLECSKQACSLNNGAWNNGIGLGFYFVGFRKPGND